MHTVMVGVDLLTIGLLCHAFTHKIKATKLSHGRSIVFKLKRNNQRILVFMELLVQ